MVSAALVMIAVLASVVTTMFAFKAVFTSPRWVVKSKLSMAGQFLQSVSVLWETWFLFQPKEWSSVSFSCAWLAVSPGILLPRDFFFRLRILSRDSKFSNSALLKPFSLCGLLGSHGKYTALIFNPLKNSLMETFVYHKLGSPEKQCRVADGEMALVPKQPVEQWAGCNG